MKKLKDQTKKQLVGDVKGLRQRITELELAEAELEQAVNEKENIIATLSSGEDITGRKRIEEALHESEERYRKLFQQSVEAIYMFDPETKRILEANNAFLDFLGYKAEEVCRLTLYDFVVHKRVNIDAYIYHILMSGAIIIGERLWRRKDGTLIDVWVTASKIRQRGKDFCFVVAHGITERKKAEEVLRKAKEFSDSLIASMQDGFSVLDSRGVHIDVNPAFCQMTGFSREEIIGVGAPHPYWPPEAYEEIERAFQKTLLCEFGNFELTFMRKNGERFPVIVSPSCIKDKQGNIISYFATVKDITERKQAEAEREKLLQDLGERVKEIRCIADLSRLAEKHWISIKEFVQRAVSILPPAWQYPEICSARITLDSEEFKTANFRETEWCQSADIKVDGKKFGAVMVCYLEEKPTVDEGPFLKEERILINTVADFLGHIIQHRKTEAEIRDSEAKFRTIFDNANDGILLADIENKKFHSGNAKICHMLGYSREEIKNMGVMDIHPEKDIPYVIEQFKKQSRKEIDVAQNLPVKRKDGSVFYADVNSAPIEISGKLYLLGIFRDTTERIKAEESLRETRDYLEKLLNYANAPIIVWDPKSIITSFNHAFERLTGYTNKEVIGKTLHILFPEASKEESLKKIESTVSGKYWESVEIPILCKDGSIRIALWNSANIYAKDARTLIATIAQGQDITERKRTENELRAAKERLQILSKSSLETLENERRYIARELHDEIGQKLTALRINLENMQRLSNSTVHMNLINENIAIVERLMQQIRNLSLDLRPSILDDLGLVPALRWYVNRLEKEAEIVIQFIADSLYHRLSVEIETACFRIAQEALTNVLRHAKARQVTVELRQMEKELQLTVSDDGIGFDVNSANERAVLGESFGLLGMQERITLLGGTIEIESMLSRGTKVIAYFPSSEP